MKNDEIFEKIEAWLSGELPPEEAKAFEAEIAADSALATEVERHRRGREALDRLAEQALQADMALWQNSLDELPDPPADASPVLRPSNKLPWILGGLLFILLGGTAYWLWPSEKILQSPSPGQENISPSTKTEVPIANTPTEKPINEITSPQKSGYSQSSQLIAMAKPNLSDFQESLKQQYGQTMGDSDEGDSLFMEGVNSFRLGNLKSAKKTLLLVPQKDSYFPSAQELLAFIYYREQNYHKAAECYEFYANQSADATADWRLLQFYLLDYQNRKADFSNKLEEIVDPKNQHPFQKEAEKLKQKLGKILN